MSPGCGPFGLQGLDWQNLCRRLLNNRYILKILALSLVVSEKTFEVFFSYITLYKYMTHWGMAGLEPRGLIGRIYVGDH